jgi:enterochelin esterase family protein
MESRVLRGNRPGDPNLREVPVYLPPGYDDSPKRRYPVVVVLTGFTGSGRMLLNRSNFTEAIDLRMDRLIATGRARPMILVMPDCYTRYGGSQYLNSSATGRYEDHVVHEIVPWIDSRYRTKGDRAHRGVMGKSSGGYGAMVLGMKHPGVFGALASHSGDAYFEYCYLPDFPKAIDGLRKHGGVEGFMRAFEKAPRKKHDLVGVLNIIAMAACYGPRPRAPLGFDLPFDLDTGRLDERVWDRWLRLDPVRMIPQHAAALRKLRLLFIDVGTRDEYNLHHGARILRRTLRRHGIRHVYEEFDDGHMDISYRYDASLARMSRALG